ncbi:MAG: hypothetical protein ACP5GJ_00960 [Nanopusillaceae archaeon]
MRNQINFIFYIIISAIIILSLILYFLISYNYSIKKQNITSIEQYSSTIQNSVILLPYINDPIVNLSYAFLLSYWSTSGNDTYCINQNICTNISQDIIQYFESIYGNRWNLTVYFVPPVTGWIVHMFIFVGNLGDWDSCQINPPNDNNEFKWYEWNYTYFYVSNYQETVIAPNGNILNLTGAGWVNATAPFHQQFSCPDWGLNGLYSPATCTYSSVQKDICEPLSKIFPQENFTPASVFCPNGEWPLFQDLDEGSMVTVSPSSNLPYFFQGCNNYGCVNENTGHYYVNPPTYKTATNINLLAYYLGLISFNDVYNKYVIVGSFYTGKVYIPSDCQQLFIDYPWHEVIRLYIAFVNKTGQPDYIFLAADPDCNYSNVTCPTGVYDNVENINGTIVGKQCPLVYLIGDNINSWGIYQFNITKWAIDDRDPNVPYIKISAAYWDPHYGSNGIAMARVYCITKDGKELELNAFLFRENGKYISLGYPVPPGVNTYVFDFYYPTDTGFLGGYLVAILRVW